MKRILSVSLHRETDENPDLSYLGEYTSRAVDGAIDRKERGDMERGQHRYFVPAMTGEETGNPDSPEADYRRMERYNAGDWYCLYIYASAKVQLTGNLVQTIRSGGLSGIESDSEESDFREIETDELMQLQGELTAIGFPSSAINTAFKGAVRKR